MVATWVCSVMLVDGPKSHCKSRNILIEYTFTASIDHMGSKASSSFSPKMKRSNISMLERLYFCDVGSKGV